MSQLRPTQACKKPCHDCPFRMDIRRYQSHADVASNLVAVLRERNVAVCHQTTHYAPGSNTPVEKPGVQPLACAGFLTMVQYVMPAEALWRLDEFDFVLKHDVPVYRSVEAFLHSACPDQNADARRLAWLQNQPKSKRARLLRELP